MEVMLDTDILVEGLRGRLEFPEDLTYSISVITLYEVLRGFKDPYLAKYTLETRLKVYDLSNPVLLTAANIYRTLKERGNIPPEADLLIASTAITYNVPLWTRNYRHFSRFEEFGLKLFRR